MGQGAGGRQDQTYFMTLHLELHNIDFDWQSSDSLHFVGMLILFKSFLGILPLDIQDCFCVIWFSMFMLVHLFDSSSRSTLWKIPVHTTTLHSCGSWDNLKNGIYKLSCSFYNHIFSCYALFKWIWTYKSHDLTSSISVMRKDRQISRCPLSFLLQLFPSVPFLAGFNCLIVSKPLPRICPCWQPLTLTILFHCVGSPLGCSLKVPPCALIGQFQRPDCFSKPQPWFVVSKSTHENGSWTVCFQSFVFWVDNFCRMSKNFSTGKEM